jgi:hypothetical protein
MNVLLLQLDGKLPNIALMRLAAHHRAAGDAVQFRRVSNVRTIEPGLWDSFDRVYASLIFLWSRPMAHRLLEIYPDAILGGTGWDLKSNLEAFGVHTLRQDYGLYPGYAHSIGFTQRGCRLRCGFCVVPEKEGAVRVESTVERIWRGPGHARNLVLLDNDFGGGESWRQNVREIRDGGFKVSFCQGINARLLSEELAESIASLKYSDDDFTCKRIYTAWDNRKDEAILFRGLNWLVKYGVKPHHIMVYMLCGYWPGETHADRDYRRRRLREFGAMPYPMAYTKTPELMGFQRWVIGAYDKRVSWEDWAGARYRPEKLGAASEFPLLEVLNTPGDGGGFA